LNKHKKQEVTWKQFVTKFFKFFDSSQLKYSTAAMKSFYTMLIGDGKKERKKERKREREKEREKEPHKHIQTKQKQTNKNKHTHTQHTHTHTQTHTHKHTHRGLCFNGKFSENG